MNKKDIAGFGISDGQTGHHVLPFYEDLKLFTSEQFYECYQRAIVRSGSSPASQDLLENLLLLLAEDSPDTWFINHNVSDFIRRLSEKQILLGLFRGFSIALSGFVQSRKYETSDIYKLLGFTRKSVKVNRDEILEDSDIYGPEISANIPLGTNIENQIKTNPILISVILFHRFIAIDDLMEKAKEAMNKFDSLLKKPE